MKRQLTMLRVLTMDVAGAVEREWVDRRGAAGAVLNPISRCGPQPVHRAGLEFSSRSAPPTIFLVGLSGSGRRRHHCSAGYATVTVPRHMCSALWTLIDKILIRCSFC